MRPRPLVNSPRLRLGPSPHRRDSRLAGAGGDAGGLLSLWSAHDEGLSEGERENDTRPR